MKRNRLLASLGMTLGLLTANSEVFADNVPYLAQTRPEIKQMVVFGDSLSDNGNLYAITSAVHRVIDSVPIIPDEPYYQGRFSNGPVWNEYLAMHAFHLDIHDSKQYLNEAYAGAWAEGIEHSLQVIPPGLNMQISNYMLAHLLEDKKHTVYTIIIGGNDYLQLRENINDATDQVTEAMKSSIKSLTVFGAKHFIIGNLPDLAKTPRASIRHWENYFGEISRLNNKKVNAVLDELFAQRSLYQDITIDFVDIEGLFNELMAHPKSYQIKDWTHTCLASPSIDQNQLMKLIHIDNPAVEQLMKNEVVGLGYANSVHFQVMKGMTSGICENQDNYLFWDEIHPTTAVHRLLALKSCEILKESGRLVAKDAQALDCDFENNPSPIG